MEYYQDVLIDPRSLIEQDDIEQEIALAKLEGIPNPSPFIILMRLKNQLQEELFGDWLPQTAEEILPAPTIMEGKDYEQLYSFLFSQDISQDTVQAFMDNPDNPENLENLLEALYQAKVIKRVDWKRTKPKKKSVARFVYETIEKSGEITQRQLFQAVSKFHPVARPAQTVRIAVRRYLASGKIKEIRPHVYAVNK